MIGLRDLLGSALGIAGDWLEGRRARAQARLAADIAVEQSRVNSDIDWDRIQAQNSANSWKDEWFTIILSLPLIAIFVPPLRESVAESFSYLQEVVPDWYLLYFGLAVSAAFGYRQVVQPLLDRVGRESPSADRGTAR